MLKVFNNNYYVLVLPSIPSTSSTVANMGMAVEEIYIMTRPQSFVRELHSNITLPCVTHHTGDYIMSKADSSPFNLKYTIQSCQGNWKISLEFVLF